MRRSASAPVDAEERGMHAGVVTAAELGMEAGAELEDRGERAVDRRRDRSSGCVVPVSSASNVDLPAPFSPMMPIASPGCHAKVEPAERPELMVAPATRDPFERAIQRPGVDPVRLPQILGAHRPHRAD